MSRARQLTSITALVRQVLSGDTYLPSFHVPQLAAGAVGSEVQVPWRHAAVQGSQQLRALNTATSTYPDASAVRLAAIDPPGQASLANADPMLKDSMDFRSNFAHFLLDASTSRQRAKEALQSMNKYLHSAKTEVDKHGASSVLLDQHIIMNYIKCEDIIISCDPKLPDMKRHYENQEDKTALKEAMTRLSLLIQNMHILIIHTKAQKFEDCTHQLFKRYMKTCNITGSTQRARSAWNALLRTGNALLLQDVDLCMLYIQTLLKHSADDDVSEDFFDDAVRELSKWHIRPPGMKGRAVAEGLPDGEDVPRYFAVHKHGQDIGWVYKDAVHAKALGVWTTRSMQQLHTVLTSMRAVRTGLAPGERVPEWLTLSNFHAHIILSNCCWQQHAALNAPPDQLEDIMRFALEDMESHIGSQASHHDSGVLRSCPQYIDEGLVQHLTLLCERIQNGSLALKALSVLSRTVARLPVSPAAERPTTSTELVGKLETHYAGVGAENLGQVVALDPVRQLHALAERIGRSTDTWHKAWEGVEALDQEGGLLQSHFNVLIAGLGQLPDGATLQQTLDDSTEAGMAASRSSLVQKAAELHSLLDKCFDGKVSVHTFNALLSVFCRPDGGQESTQYIMNLLQLMDENSVTKTFETFELLIEHWARRRVYGALLATVEDMRAAGMRPGAPELIAASQKAEASQMHVEAEAIRAVLEDLGYTQSPQVRQRYQRPIDDRGRVLRQ